MLFSADERVRLVRDAVSDLGNVTVNSYSGLLINYAAALGVDVLVRGLRATSDFDYEFQLALHESQDETRAGSDVLLGRHSLHISQFQYCEGIAELGGDVSDLYLKL